ncbi:hypothetical protein ACIOD2_31055 [Amycolatopsis sp. NPDC088138]|uniref:hypothetical protein n=1 Tax=Amycolatopsis sp. NPDC088138 TaxID=3363938 RepID=UPI003823298C
MLVVQARPTQGEALSCGGQSEPGDHAIGRSRGGPTTKIHLACDGHGRPLPVVLTGGNVNDCTVSPRSWRASSSAGRAGGRPPAFDRTAHRRRNVVERCFNRFKQFRAIATRFDKTAISCRGMIDSATLLIRL